MENVIYLMPALGALGLIFVIWKSAWVNKQEEGTDKMKEIAKHIADGAMAFLKAEYKVLGIFVVCVALLLGFTASSETSSPLVAVSCVKLATGGFSDTRGAALAVLVSTRKEIDKFAFDGAEYPLVVAKLIGVRNARCRN